MVDSDGTITSESAATVSDVDPMLTRLPVRSTIESLPAWIVAEEIAAFEQAASGFQSAVDAPSRPPESRWLPPARLTKLAAELVPPVCVEAADSRGADILKLCGKRSPLPPRVIRPRYRPGIRHTRRLRCAFRPFV